MGGVVVAMVKKGIKGIKVLEKETDGTEETEESEEENILRLLYLRAGFPTRGMFSTLIESGTFLPLPTGGGGQDPASLSPAYLAAKLLSDHPFLNAPDIILRHRG